MAEEENSAEAAPEGKTIDECVAEIFANQKNVGNTVAWRIKKSRFKNGTLPEHGKIALLKEFGYVMNNEATYIRIDKE